ncbi:hypothetical protein L2E82_11823 [Cichorium intybus]|uniref:Uncharacterized protein n=1 Tax=Cichorium intybus TaxID=13427 RepID=A0ACB9GGB4_CICIN|nr:hypothetical protein L2E82_11823 [Cichorium intybus]
MFIRFVSVHIVLKHLFDLMSGCVESFLEMPVIRMRRDATTVSLFLSLMKCFSFSYEFLFGNVCVAIAFFLSLSFLLSIWLLLYFLL